MKVLIIGNGSVGAPDFYRNIIRNMDYVICCDGGMQHARKLEVTPDVIMGDLDSAQNEDILYFEEKRVAFRKFPAHKDDTDLEIGIKAAIEAGACDITIIGGIGTRLDHTLGNMHLLKLALDNKITARLVNEHNTIFLIDKFIELHGKKGQLVSLIPFTPEVSGITTAHLEYPLQNGVLSAGKSQGISNVMTGPAATVSVKEGLLFVIMARD